MLTEFFKNGTLLLFWFLSFSVMMVVTVVAIVIRIYILNEFSKEWERTLQKGRKRHEKNTTDIKPGEVHH